MNWDRCHRVIAIVCRLDPNAYPTATWKGTGKNGSRRDIGTGEASKAAKTMTETTMMGRRGKERVTKGT
jgi:hypothetical protein